jgi:hypothetical protein
VSESRDPDAKRLCNRIYPVVARLTDLMDRSGGFAWDTYDTRVGWLYEVFSKRRETRLARYALFALYGLELAAPITYRRLRGIPKTWDPMGNSYRAGTEISFYLVDRDARRLQKARTLLEQVATRAVGLPGQRGFALGFPCITGSNKLWSTSTPVAHYTMRVARKLLRFEQVSSDLQFRPVLDEAIRFLLQGLSWIERDGTLGVGYTPDDPLQVVNIWADVASLLAAYDGAVHYAEAGKRARALFMSVASHQDPSGSFPYFARWEASRGAIDNTHTAMVLGALADGMLSYPELRPTLKPVLELGVRYWLDNFFDAGTGRHWNLLDRRRDVFMVCLGDALYAINRLLRPELGLDPELATRIRSLEGRTIEWTFDNMLRADGRFLERRLRYRNYCVKSIRSFDGLTCDALALYAARIHLGESARLWTQ